MIKPTLLSALTKAINRYLHLDPESKKRLKKLQDKTITIELLPFHFLFQCLFTEEGVHLKTGDQLKTDTRICGTPLQLINVMLNKKERQRFFADDVLIEGDAELGQHVIELFDALEIDWEEYSSHFMGDVPAHYIWQFIRKTGKWLQHTEKSMQQNIVEFIHEETEWLPMREALHDFFNEIDNLRADADRLEAKINQLYHLHAHHPTQEGSK